MGLNKAETAAAMGLDIRPPADAPVPTRPSQSKIGAEIVRRAAYGKVTVEAVIKYLDALRKCGIISRAALMANLSYSSVRSLREKDAEFAAEEEMAKQLWIAENIDEPFRQIAQGEWTKPHFNQKTGALMGSEKVISPQIALAWARKFDPAYREKLEVDNKHSGGVVVVTAPAMTQADWEARKEMRNQQRREVIDVDQKTGDVLPAAPPAGTLPPPAVPPAPAGGP